MTREERLQKISYALASTIGMSERNDYTIPLPPEDERKFYAAACAALGVIESFDNTEKYPIYGKQLAERAAEVN